MIEILNCHQHYYKIITTYNTQYSPLLTQRQKIRNRNLMVSSTLVASTIAIYYSSNFLNTP